MTRIFWTTLATAVCLSTSAAWPDDREKPALGKTPAFELMHLWKDDIESPALAVLRNTVQGAGLKWIEHRVDGNYYGVRTAFAERLAMGIPPDATFWIGGSSLADFVSNGTFRGLDGTPELVKLKSSLQPSVLAALTFGHGLSAVPLGIHIQNYVVMNKTAYQRASIPMPRTWKELISSAPALQRIGVTPLSMSDQPWQIRFLFGSILAEQMGAEAFQEFLKAENPDQLPPTFHSKLIDALTVFDQLRGLTNDDYQNLSWGEATRRVKVGRAAAVVLGDFMTPIFEDESSFACGLAPGNSFAIWSIDVLAFPRLADAAQTAIQDRAIKALIAPTALHDYIAKKGGLPATVESPSPDFNHCANTAIGFWNSSIAKVNIDAHDWSDRLNKLSAIAKLHWSKKMGSAVDAANLMTREIFSEPLRGGTEQKLDGGGHPVESDDQRRRGAPN